ncbi:helix-turn-helix transcriptional regulator [Flavobacterium jejuense]|uniref:Helix-turn-helix transcriptional regulator n=1 Tax=Flavobacterium jejuense TaxID=1544455 RepID=A0ABX0IX03_9FLAO|nr:AraC family transcriptional regulator [Flavobacterium jejuense]NHN26334.1 helix-turn-helix transcriptional regulator [Flavobacterium jejuense]
MKQYFIYFFFVFFFSFFVLHAQVDEITLEKITFKELLQNFAKSEGNLELQKKYARIFLNKAKKSDSQLMIAKGYYMTSLLFDSHESIKYLDSVAYYSEKESNEKFPMIAFYEKAVKLDILREFNLALENYIKAENWAKKNNDLDYVFKSKYSIALLKSEDMGEPYDALVLYKECYVFYRENKELNNAFYEDYLRSIFAIADVYKSLKNIDSTSFYNRLGYVESLKSNNERLLAFFILNEGANQYLKKNYKAAIDSIDKALPLMKKYNDKINQIASYYYYAKSFQGLKQIDKTVKNYEKIDSVYKQSKYLTPEFVDGYHYLIKHYKKKGDKEKQLYYLNALMSIDSIFQINYKELSKKLKTEYEIPILIQEKESIINSLNQDKKTNYWIIGLLGFGVTLSLVLLKRLTQQKKQYKQRFEVLMNEQKNKNEEKDAVEINNKESRKDDSLGIAFEIVKNIADQLMIFEKQKHFLKPNITVQSLAQQMETNSKYLSIVVNAEKQKSFSNYINDLRVDYAVSELKNNKEIRKYTIAAIAEDVGFNTSESFSKAFFKRTGLKPSYFIKELREL